MIGKRIFFDKETGGVILEIQPQNGTLPTVERNIEQFTLLSDRNRNTFDVLELEFGEYAQDFAESAGYRVNAETRKLEFAEKMPSDPAEEPVFQQPLSEQLKTMDKRVQFTEEAITALLDMGMM